MGFVLFFKFFFPPSHRTSMCALVACLYQRRILLLRDSTLPKQTAGPLKNSVLRSTLQLHRTQCWMHAVLESQVKFPERTGVLALKYLQKLLVLSGLYQMKKILSLQKLICAFWSCLKISLVFISREVLTVLLWCSSQYMFKQYWLVCPVLYSRYFAVGNTSRLADLALKW